MLLRGLFRRCPWCGRRGAYFDGWFGKLDACRGCGLQWRRGDVGYELGAAAIAAILVLGLLVVGLGVAVALMWPDIDVVPLYVVLGAGAIVLPVLLYPSSYTVWQAVDILMRPVTPGDFDDPAEQTDTVDETDTADETPDASGDGAGTEPSPAVRPEDA